MKLRERIVKELSGKERMGGDCEYSFQEGSNMNAIGGVTWGGFKSRIYRKIREGRDRKKEGYWAEHCGLLRGKVERALGREWLGKGGKLEFLVPRR